MYWSFKTKKNNVKQNETNKDKFLENNDKTKKQKKKRKSLTLLINIYMIMIYIWYFRFYYELHIEYMRVLVESACVVTKIRWRIINFALLRSSYKDEKLYFLGALIFNFYKK